MPGFTGRRPRVWRGSGGTRGVGGVRVAESRPAMRTDFLVILPGGGSLKS